ncbi:MAG TPA: hypothetical protein VFZ65_15880 [Planctomycetota bacterium]|nr:hypothetical protein [Planctomycetota bacterium]
MNPTTTPIQQIRDGLRTFGERYGYDTSYMERLLDAAPNAYERFAAAMAMSQPGEALSREAGAVAAVTVLRGDDCGPCLQLTLRMAVEAGVDRKLLETALDHPERLPAPLRDIHELARQVVAGENGDLERIARLEASLGKQAFGELAVAITGARIYPTLKRALGEARSCHRASLDF